MSFADKTLTCRDCGREFTWTAGEQAFYEQKGFTNPPTRCQDCRAERKASGGYGSRSGGQLVWRRRSSYGGGGGSARAAVAPAKCIPRPAPRAAKRRKYRLYHVATSPCTARTASKASGAQAGAEAAGTKPSLSGKQQGSSHWTSLIYVLHEPRD